MNLVCRIPGLTGTFNILHPVIEKCDLGGIIARIGDDECEDLGIGLERADQMGCVVPIKMLTQSMQVEHVAPVQRVGIAQTGQIVVRPQLGQKVFNACKRRFDPRLKQGEKRGGIDRKAPFLDEILGERLR